METRVTALKPGGAPKKPDADIARRLGLEGDRRAGGYRFRWWHGAIAVAALVVLGWLLLRGGGGPVYVTQPVTRGGLSVSVSATGTLAPRDQVDVGAEVSGRIDAIAVDYNDHVKKGEVLARINTDNFRAALAQARATLAQAEATLVEAKHTRDRYVALAKSDALSRQQRDNAVADYKRALAGVALAKAQVESDETTLSKATIVSPIDGVVLDRKVSVGQTVVSAFQTPVLFTLASDLSQMELDVDIDEADVGQVSPGAAATFTVDAYPAKRFNAKLIAIRNAPKTVQGVVTYQGVLYVSNPENLLRPGMTATAEIHAAGVTNALLVPNGALRFTPPNMAEDAGAAPTGAREGRVWVEKDGKLSPRDLTLGISDGKQTAVVSGNLAVGEKLAVNVQMSNGQASGGQGP
jgi:HlyD family secretion protein